MGFVLSGGKVAGRQLRRKSALAGLISLSHSSTARAAQAWSTGPWASRLRWAPRVGPGSRPLCCGPCHPPTHPTPPTGLPPAAVLHRAVCGAAHHRLPGPLARDTDRPRHQDCPAPAGARRAGQQPRLRPPPPWHHHTCTHTHLPLSLIHPNHPAGLPRRLAAGLRAGGGTAPGVARHGARRCRAGGWRGPGRARARAALQRLCPPCLRHRLALKQDSGSTKVLVECPPQSVLLVLGHAWRRWHLISCLH